MTRSAEAASRAAQGTLFHGLPDLPALRFLQQRPQWVAWDYRGARKAKVPVDPNYGENARVNDSSTWSDYPTAADRARSAGLAGVGFVLTDDDGIVGIDLDGCRDPKTTALDAWAADVVALRETYVEVSPSGCGLRMLALATGDATGLVSTIAGVEVYARGRYLTITGNHLPDAPVEIKAAPRTLAMLRDRVAAMAKPSGADDAQTVDHLIGKDTPFTRINDVALRKLSAWVPVLLPAARKHGKGYRVTSSDLGRELEEDLSIMPNGIKDFGIHDMGDAKGGRRTPIDLVLEYAAAAELDMQRGAIGAALWLCEQLTINPDIFGWHNPQSAFGHVKEIGKRPTSRPASLITDSRGRPTNVLANAMSTLRTRPELDVFALDEMARQAVMLKGLPAPALAGTDPDDAFPRPIRDTDVSRLQELIQHDGLSRLSRDLAHQAVEARAAEKAFHPVKAYLDHIAWDGTKRITSWLTTYLGAELSTYHRGIGAMFLTAMVARVFNPGCQADFLLVLEGPQGAGKSSACEILAGEWFSASLPDVSAEKEGAQHLRGKWLIEIAELAAIGRAETERLKSFISRRVERYRPAYGRLEVVEPRQCLLIGTTNRSVYLRDETGGRRFWPVKVGGVDRERLQQDRDQLFAEAVVAYRGGDRWWPDAAFEAQHIRPQQEERFEVDVWEEAILGWQSDKTRVSVGEVARDAIGLVTDRVGTAAQRRIGGILQRLGWLPTRDHLGRAYVRKWT